MRIYLILLVLCAALISTGAAADSSAQVTVTGVSIDPGVFMPWDTGTVQVTVQNTGTLPISLSAVRMTGEQNVEILTSPHTGSGMLGAGNSMTFTYTIRVRGEEGIFYPRFSMNFMGGGSLSEPVLLRVDRRPLDAGISSRPDVFMEGRKENVVVSLGNPRMNTISSVSVTPVTGVADVVPTTFFIGSLEPGESRDAAFSVTPTGEGDLTFNVQYRNGQNTHTVPLTIPITPGIAKKAADPIVSNIEVTSVAGGYRITGDVSNAGLESARSVVMTTKAPAAPIDPFRVYVVGTLDPDDFSSFEVTFAAKDLEEIPLVIRYRDGDGNLYEETVMATIRSGIQPVQEHDGGLSPMMIGIILLSVVIVAGALVYSRKKKR